MRVAKPSLVLLVCLHLIHRVLYLLALKYMESERSENPLKRCWLNRMSIMVRLLVIA